MTANENNDAFVNDRLSAAHHFDSAVKFANVGLAAIVILVASPVLVGWELTKATFYFARGFGRMFP